MANRVNVTITARDLTRGQLNNMRRNFRNLGQDMDRAIGNRTRGNFDRLSRSVNQARRDLNSMRGAIPEQEFFRLDNAIQRAQRRLRGGFDNTSQRDLQRVQQQIRRVTSGFRDLDDNAQIRVRVDTSALRRADARLAAWRAQQGRNDVRVRVRADVDSNSISRRLRRALTSPLRGITGFIGGTLSDGVGQGIFNGFKSGGVAGGAVLAATLIAALSLIGAALSGLIVVALGGAFATVGLIAAAQSKQIQKQWSGTLDHLKELFKGMGEPMIPVLSHGIDLLDEMATKAAPKLREAMAGMAPAVQTFMDKLADGFSRFGENLFEPIQEAWNVFAPVFGDKFSDFMSDLGSNFADIANLVRDHSTEIGIALDIVFGAISGIVEIVEFFGQAWVTSISLANSAISGVINYALIPLAKAALGTFSAILAGADSAFGWIPGIGDKLGDANEAFAKWSVNTIKSLEGAGRAAANANKALDEVNRERVLKANIKSWQAKIADAKASLKSVPKSKQAKVLANIKDLQSKVRAAKGELASIKNKNVRITITKVNRTIYETSNRIAKNGGGLINGYAKGGIVSPRSKAVTGGIRSNMTLVGENGPEIADLPPGTRVRSNGDTRRLMRENNTNTVNTPPLIIQSSGRRVDDMLLEILREAIHQRGGDPVRVLGGSR